MKYIRAILIPILLSPALIMGTLWGFTEWGFKIGYNASVMVMHKYLERG